MSEYIIKEVEKIINPVYLVGGSVRDILLERTPKDYDFTTPLSPDEVEDKVKAAGRHAYAIGKKFGTIGFKVPDESGKYQYVEVTTFRREQYKAGSRKPEVEFVKDLKEDLARRDLTMNAVALKDSEYFDPFGGRIDIMAKKIKAVGVAKDRFKEDPLRMLRVCRFAAQLDFEIDPNLIGIIRKMAPMIATVSRERWVQELDKLFVGEYFDMGIWQLYNTGLLKFMLPELWSLMEDDELRCDVYTELEWAKDVDEAWSGLLKHIGKPYVRTMNRRSEPIYPKHEVLGLEIATGICSRLRFSNDRTKKVINQFKEKI